MLFKVKNTKSLKKDCNTLQLELSHLFRKRFNLYTQFKMGQLKQTHILRKIRRDIARIKFFLLKNFSKKI